MPAAFAGAAAAIAGPLIGSALSGSASTGAAQTQANSANQAAQVQQNMFNQTQGNLAPWMSVGSSALGALQNLLGSGNNGAGIGSSPLTSQNTPFSFDPSQIQNMPQYQWQLQQGTQNILNNQSQLGGVGGNTLEALSNYGQNTANQNYQSYYNNALNTWSTNNNANTAYQQQLYNMLMGVSSSGQNAATNLGNQATTVGGQIGGDLIGAGNALAAGQIGSANALSGGLNGAGTNALMYSMMNQNQQPYGASFPAASNPAGVQTDAYASGGFGT